MQSSIAGIRSRSATPVSATLQDLVDGKQRLEEELLALQQSIEATVRSSGRSASGQGAAGMMMAEVQVVRGGGGQGVDCSGH